MKKERKNMSGLYQTLFGEEKTITLEEYDKLTEFDKKVYKGVYRTKKKRVSSSCNECGHSTGWYTENVNIGKPISYTEKSFYDIAFEKMARDIILDQKTLSAARTKFPIRFKGFDNVP